ncbi:MAG TPA: phosphatidylserine/phosphatidylglycerophosphate/cardiolipin synthase family protein, partial [Polyangiales bacterium]|nr:phosphatidylserine/phosphatidylglycerophosphate/cardiolipin synthase family protein [Polyangiales bacterium]
NLSAASLGVYRLDEAKGTDPLLAIERRIRVIRPTLRELWLYDAELTAAALHALQTLAADSIAVRLRPTRSRRVIRQGLRAAGLPLLIVDARAVLDEGDALDVSEALDAVRLARVAARLQRAGFKVAGIVYRGIVRPLGQGFRALSEGELVSASPAGESEQDAQSSYPSGGNAIELELDNTKARRWLLEAIAHSTHSVNLQSYMALDDAVGRATCDALAAAAARGVTVRVLVDSLHGMHGSFGASNPLLVKLAAVAGVELRASRPIVELPTLLDLKQRDHRKLLVCDGRLALVGGRNLSHEYYVGFDEVPLTAACDWRMLPWLDAGARLEGPVVADVQRAFREAWVDAGGASFEIASPLPLGSCAARVVVHRGLRDANTLETYLELIASAKAHVYVVNGFPLMLELQHALLGALRRGVRVRALCGHVTPTHGSQPFGGAWSAARMAATELVHSRLDPLVAAGAEAYLFALRDIPGWSQGLGVVHPHVHAKAISVDGVQCAVGSANLDITASYWESEVLVVVEDAAITRCFETQLDARIATSTALRSDDAAWQESAKRRTWMRHWPGVLSV